MQILLESSLVGEGTYHQRYMGKFGKLTVHSEVIEHKLEVVEHLCQSGRGQTTA